MNTAIRWTTQTGTPSAPRTSRVVAMGASAILHALMVAAMVIMNAIGPTRRAPKSASHESPMEVQRVDALPDDTPTPSPIPGVPSHQMSDREQALLNATRASAADFPDFAIELGTIQARSNLLFPFLSPGISLDQFGALSQPAPASSTPMASLTFAPSDQRKADPQPPLHVGPGALQTVTDRSWSRRYRWSAFQVIVTLADSHSATDGELSALIQMYVKQNALQPYTDGLRRDDRLWVQLGIAADQVDFIGFISRYATKHPGTNATVELLFLLDTLATASLDNLLTLMGTNPVVDLQWTKHTSPAAFATIATVHRYYQAELQNRHLGSIEAITEYFQGVRLSILQRIMRSTPLGFRSNDARFLIGTILWSQRRETEALQMWRAIAGVAGDDRYVDSYTLLRPATGASGEPIDRREIDRILARQQARWVSFSFTRLRQFGYRFDTY